MINNDFKTNLKEVVNRKFLHIRQKNLLKIKFNQAKVIRLGSLFILHRKGE